jgi:hypothetical protein
MSSAVINEEEKENVYKHQPRNQERWIPDLTITQKGEPKRAASVDFF